MLANTFIEMLGLVVLCSLVPFLVGQEVDSLFLLGGRSLWLENKE
jgi:hypothetical protein